MKKFLFTVVALLATTSAFAGDIVFGVKPVFGAQTVTKKSGVDFTTQ